MKLNSNVVIFGERVVLVPYLSEHVKQYHEWMQDLQLQDATGSEPLSLEAEYEMQKAWAQDEDKCTFILLDRDKWATSTQPASVCTGMVGDVNLFLNDAESRSTGEVEVMVAEKESRRKGIAKEALSIFMAYLVCHLNLDRFRAKIKAYNTSSIALFRGLGFQQVGESAIFKEVTLEYAIDDIARTICSNINSKVYYSKCTNGEIKL